MSSGIGSGEEHGTDRKRAGREQAGREQAGRKRADWEPADRERAGRERADRRRSDEARWGPRPDGGDGSDDVIEMGGLPARWPWHGRAARIGAAVAMLAVGLVIGFAAGHLSAGPGAGRSGAGQSGASQSGAGHSGSTRAHGVGTAHRIRIAASDPPTVGQVPTDPSGATPQIFFTGNRCSVQHGRTLQLGIQIVNRSGHTITVNQIRSELPLGGLRQISSAMTTCGALPVPGGVPLTTIVNGADAWLSMTFDVLVRCPAPSPVLFAISYSPAGRLESIYFDGFPDLGSVPYTGCHR